LSIITFLFSYNGRNRYLVGKSNESLGK